MTTTDIRAELEERRAQLCRLTPEQALATLDEAELFLLDRGMLTLTSDSALPSLFGATHEQPFARGKPGFGAYPKTKWWWGGALGELPGIVPTKLHRGKSLYLSPRAAVIVDPLCRAAVAAAASGELGEPCRQIVVHLEAAGPSLSEELKDELGLDARTLRSARQKLEACGGGLKRLGPFDHGEWLAPPLKSTNTLGSARASLASNDGRSARGARSRWSARCRPRGTLRSRGLVCLADRRANGRRAARDRATTGGRRRARRVRPDSW